MLIGTDPEVFLKNKITNRFVSAHGRFPGSKEEPYRLDQGAVQVDGHALEFNTDPVDNEDDFVHVVNHVFNQVKGIVSEIDPNLEIVLEPVARFDEEYFETLPPESKVLGCTPDYSAETGYELDAPTIGFEPIRTSSGHIHIGWTKDEDAFDEQQFKKRFILANRITPYLLKASAGWETASSRERRLYYGREGAFRPKPYGVELRALDCLWLKSDETIRAVFRAAKEGFEKESRFAL
jgi:hypothetical protein